MNLQHSEGYFHNSQKLAVFFLHNIKVSCRLFGLTLRRLGVAGPTTRRAGNIGIDHPETLKIGITISK